MTPTTVEDRLYLKKLYTALEKVKQQKLGNDWETAKQLTELEKEIKKKILEIVNPGTSS